MGWTGYYAQYYKNGKIDRKKECDAYFLESLNKGYFEVLKSTMVGSVYYAAVKQLKGKINGEIVDLPEKEQLVFGVVMLTSVDGREFLYKEMTEDMGPGYYDCPESILNLLSKTDDKYALEWRENCRKQNASKKLLNKCPVETIIQFTIGNGEVVSLIKKAPCYQFKTEWWKVVDKNTYYKKSQIPLDFEILPEIKYPLVGIIYNWKGLAETNHLYSFEEIMKKDYDLTQALVSYKGIGHPIIDGYAFAANKTTTGILIRNANELKEFLQFKYNDPEFETSQNDDWYATLLISDVYGSNEESKAMKRAILDFGITSEQMTY